MQSEHQVKSTLERTKKYWPIFVIALMITFVFLRTLHGEFLGWDDDRNILENLALKNGSIWNFWAAPYNGLYVPIIYSLWTALYHFFGDDPVPYHAFNILLHFLNAALVYRLFKKISDGDDFWSLIAALIFAIHPLQIEPVAWISGARDVLSSFFALLAIQCSLKKNKWLVMLGAPILFGLGLLCKPAVIVIPFLLVLLNLFYGQRQKYLSYMPWFIIAVPIFFLTFKVQERYGFMSVVWWQRPLIMIDAFGFYLEKFFWPRALSADYGRSPGWVMSHAPNLTMIVFTLFAIATFFSRDLFWSMVAFVLLLLPVSGVLPFGFQQISTVADRYMYLPTLPLIWFVIVALMKIDASFGKRLGAPAIVLVCSILIFNSFNRAEVWQTNTTFFEEMARENPMSFSAHINLASILSKQGDYDLAAVHIFKAAEIAPNNAPVVLNKYVMFQHLGRYDEVIDYYTHLPDETRGKLRTLQPIEWANFLNSVAVALDNTGRSEEALACLCEADRINPEHKEIRSNIQILQSKLHTGCKFP